MTTRSRLQLDTPSPPSPLAPLATMPHFAAPRRVRLNRSPLRRTATLGDLRLLEVVGTGGFGKVLRAVAPGGGSGGGGSGGGDNGVVAVKRLKARRLCASSGTNEAAVQAAEREVALHRACHAHPNIPTCHDFVSTKHEMFEVMDFAEDGDLFNFVVANGPLAEAHARDLTRQLLSALHHMHSLDIAHCDVKPENVLLTNRARHVLLCDFGHAKWWNEHTDALLGQAGGTVRCQPPEVFVPNPITKRVEYDPKAMDVFALGTVLFFMLTSYFPFQGRDKKDTIARITRARLSVPWPHFVSFECEDFLRSCLDPIMELRPTAAELMRHPFVSTRYDKL